MSRMAAQPRERYLLRARDLADARYADRLTVADMARAVGAGSVGSFTVSFGRVFGQSPTAYRRVWPPPARYVRIPRCVAMSYARPRNRTFREDERMASS